MTSPRSSGGSDRRRESNGSTLSAQRVLQRILAPRAAELTWAPRESRGKQASNGRTEYGDGLLCPRTRTLVMPSVVFAWASLAFKQKVGNSSVAEADFLLAGIVGICHLVASRLGVGGGRWHPVRRCAILPRQVVGGAFVAPGVLLHVPAGSPPRPSLGCKPRRSVYLRRASPGSGISRVFSLNVR